MRLISVPSVGTQLMFIELLDGKMSGDFKKPNTGDNGSKGIS